ncbi:hypothetical protein EMPS_07191 [Entomortierella parvispora]|uniref:N-acetyltransferase domain-containing protein n=1 Tax=Entomortierella parvispora TaxID=205924 RepID=A0A9P3HE42_9FUNG|nr:hypothetical protein EMPS_07191 [Entomortierella parvispora]
MSDRSWSPPLESHTRTLTTVSVTRAKPEHLKAIHEIQLLAYPGRADFHESEDVFRSKIEAYPAGNFVALATYSVVTDDDTSGWTKERRHSDEQSDEDHENDEEDTTPLDHQISVIEITETAPDGTTTTTTATKTSSGDEETVHIVRARTPDIVEGDGRTAPSRKAPGFRSSTSEGDSKIGESSSSTTGLDAAGLNEETDDEEPMTTVLFQWEKPIGYLFSHPYSRESVTLHRMADNVVKAKKATEDIPAKKMKVDSNLESESEEEEKDPYEHDQFMERYYIHDCAIHPEWRGKGLAAKLWKALEDSLTPSRDGDDDRQNEVGDLVDTEEEDDGDQGQDKKAGSAQDHDEAASSSSQPNPRRSHRRRHRGKGRRHHKGAPNLKDIVLVSVQGTRPFWQHTGGFQVVPDHDMDLSVYGDEAFFMSKPFIL